MQQILFPIWQSQSALQQKAWKRLNPGKLHLSGQKGNQNEKSINVYAF